jgi:hypothetical protein
MRRKIARVKLLEKSREKWGFDPEWKIIGCLAGLPSTSSLFSRLVSPRPEAFQKLC